MTHSKTHYSKEAGNLVPHWFKSGWSWRTRESQSAFGLLKNTHSASQMPGIHRKACMRHAREGWGDSWGALLLWEQSGRSAGIDPTLAKRGCRFPVIAAAWSCADRSCAGTAAFLAALPSIASTRSVYGCSLHVRLWQMAHSSSSRPWHLLPVGHVTLQMTARAVIWFSSEPADLFHIEANALLQRTGEKFLQPRQRRYFKGIFSFYKSTHMAYTWYNTWYI